MRPLVGTPPLSSMEEGEGRFSESSREETRLTFFTTASSITSRKMTPRFSSPTRIVLCSSV